MDYQYHARQILAVTKTHIFAYVVSSRVRLLISAAPAKGALKASVQYPMIPTNLTRSLGLMALKCVVPERMLCIRAAEGDVMMVGVGRLWSSALLSVREFQQ